ncbi:MAG: putative 2OG-Fe(II) oxygenase [Pseudohongiella sp.]|uniref:putative 2OG-Fe(II) oxygenase n=1 Tax=Pseudohongiella sp. TaxID=1979412 RepID=UPI0034A09155
MGQIIQMFSHPVITLDDYPGIDAIADTFHAKAMGLMQEYPDAGLISDAWHSGKRAQSADDIRQHGFTSYYSVNLAKQADFDFINSAAREVFAQYLRVVDKAGIDMRLDSAWASVYGRGHYVPQHTHPMSHLSLVFYAAATDGTGKLVFENPARAHFQHFYPPEICWMPYRFSIQPKKGMFVVFPSYMTHNTEPHESDDLRIIYSANVQLGFSKLTDAEKA